MTHPHEERETQAAFLELFFDLVFVYAITQVAALIQHHHDAEGFARAVAIFLLIWWGWSQFTWTLNGINVADRRVHVAVLVATVLAFFMAEGLPDAYTAEGEWFSVPFALMMTIGLALYWWGLGDEPEHQRALVTYLPLAAVGGIAAGVTGFLPDGAQEWGYGATIVLFVVAGIVSALGTPFHIYPRHFAERYGLIVIIALGESMVAVGVGSAGLERTWEFAFAVALGAGAIGVLWWAYFDWFQEATEHAIRRIEPDLRAPAARDIYTYAHFPIVLGVIAIAVAAEQMFAHPTEPLAGYARFAMASGTTLYFGGIVIAHYRAYKVVLVERALLAVAMPLIVIALAGADATVLATAATLAKVVTLVVEGLRTHPRRLYASTA